MSPLRVTECDELPIRFLVNIRDKSNENKLNHPPILLKMLKIAGRFLYVSSEWCLQWLSMLMRKQYFVVYMGGCLWIDFRS